MHFVEPLLPIRDAMAQRQSLALSDQPALAESLKGALLAFREDGMLFAVNGPELQCMADMGLEILPVCAIASLQTKDGTPSAGMAFPETTVLAASSSLQEEIKQDFSRQLTAYFPVSFVAALYELQSLMMRAGVQGYAIGGMPRDLLQFDEKRLDVKDVDITVEGDALALAHFLEENSRNFVVLEAFPEFGTAKVRYKESVMLDFASTRRETYTQCGSLPTVLECGVPLDQDVVRRDFTLNSLALSIQPLGQIVDYVNGIRDLRQKQVRVLHPASFFEDPSRILRVLKFCARFDLEPAPETLYLMRQFLKWGHVCYKGGGDRIKQELKGILNVPESPVKSRWMVFFLREGIYRLISMELDDLPFMGMEEPPDSPDSIEARMQRTAALLPQIASSLASYIDEGSFAFETYLCLLMRHWPDEAFQKALSRLCLTRPERECVEAFRQGNPKLGERFDQVHDHSPPAEIYDLFHGLPLITVVACLIQLGLRHPNRMQTVLDAFVRYKRKWEHLQLELDGNDLIAMGVPQGKLVGQMLTHLLHAKLAGQLPDRMAEVNAVRREIQRSNPFTPEKDNPDKANAVPAGPVSRTGDEIYEWEQGAWPDVAPPST